MRIVAFDLENFRSVASATLRNLASTVLIAGPNGCGKSTIFHALRLWKSAQAGYVDNEYQQWFGEFEISLQNGPDDLALLLRDKSKSVRIAGTVELAVEEKHFIRENIDHLLRDVVWRGIAPRSGRGGARLQVPAEAASLTDRYNEFGEAVTARREEIISGLEQHQFVGVLEITSDLQIKVSSNPVLQLVYSVHRPESIGAFEYHGADRSYQREQVSSVNLRLESVAQQAEGQRALYNTAAKFQNIKAQMAETYLRELIAEKAGASVSSGTRLVESLKDLFRTFFPDKEFLGPIPMENGRLSFTVRTRDGVEHDINDLSSGEKEVLYGYLRLRNLAPRHSVLLLDEPELHLNPRLVRGLSRFYDRQLGTPFDNQIWLLTHSDALLRETLGQSDCSIYHMVPASEDTTSQVIPISNGDALGLAIIDLVGESVAFQPSETLVIFEGGGDSEFDIFMTTALFPLLVSRANLVPGTNKVKVRELHGLLEKAQIASALKFRVFSVVDSDSDSDVADDAHISNALCWDVYHIENYLLDARFVLAALTEALGKRCPFSTADQVDDALRTAATEAAEDFVRDRLQRWVNAQMLGCLRIGSDPAPANMEASMPRSIRGSAARIQNLVAKQLSEVEVAAKAAEIRKATQSDLQNGEWRRTIPGRDILRRFVGSHGDGVRYDILRNLTIARMKSDGYQPSGMKAVVDAILSGGAAQRPGATQSKSVHVSS